MNQNQFKQYQEELICIGTPQLNNFPIQNLRDIARELGIIETTERKNILIQKILFKLFEKLDQYQQIDYTQNFIKTDHQFLQNQKLESLKIIIINRNNQCQRRNQFNQSNFANQQMQNYLNQQSQTTQQINNIEMQSHLISSEQQIANKECICKGFSKYQNEMKKTNNFRLITCKSCGKLSHHYCYSLNQPNNKEIKALFECADCILKKQNPLNQVIYIFVYPMLFGNPSNGFHEGVFQFMVDPNMLKRIHENKNFGVEFRCIRLSGLNFHETTFPDFSELILNEAIVHEFKPLLKVSALKKRKDESFFTPCSLLKSGINTFKIKQHLASVQQLQNERIDDTKVHVAAVYLVKKLSVDDLVEQIKLKNQRKVEESKKRIKERLAQQIQQNELGVEYEKVSILDPLSMSLIETPAIGRFCNHLSCFDLKNMINITSYANPKRWRCPICKQKCIEIFVDLYFQSILKQISILQNENPNQQISNIIFKKDGQYELVKMIDGNTKEQKEECEFDLQNNIQQQLCQEKQEIHSNEQNQEIIIIDDQNDNEQQFSEQQLIQINNSEQIQIQGQNQIIEKDCVTCQNNQQSSSENQQFSIQNDDQQQEKEQEISSQIQLQNEIEDVPKKILNSVIIEEEIKNIVQDNIHNQQEDQIMEDENNKIFQEKSQDSQISISLGTKNEQENQEQKIDQEQQSISQQNISKQEQIQQEFERLTSLVQNYRNKLQQEVKKQSQSMIKFRPILSFTQFLDRNKKIQQQEQNSISIDGNCLGQQLSNFQSKTNRIKKNKIYFKNCQEQFLKVIKKQIDKLIVFPSRQQVEQEIDQIVKQREQILKQQQQKNNPFNAIASNNTFMQPNMIQNQDPSMQYNHQYMQQNQIQNLFQNQMGKFPSLNLQQFQNSLVSQQPNLIQANMQQYQQLLMIAIQQQFNQQLGLLPMNLQNQPLQQIFQQIMKQNYIDLQKKQ